MWTIRRARLVKHLVGVVVGTQHHVPHLAQVVVRDVPVEQVGHAVDEYAGRFPPAQKLTEPVRARREVESIGPRLAAPYKSLI